MNLTGCGEESLSNETFTCRWDQMCLLIDHGRSIQLHKLKRNCKWCLFLRLPSVLIVYVVYVFGVTRRPQFGAPNIPPRFRPLVLSFARLSTSLEQAANMGPICHISFTVRVIFRYHLDHYCYENFGPHKNCHKSSVGVRILGNVNLQILNTLFFYKNV